MWPDFSPELLAARPDVAAPEGQLESWQRLRFFEALAQAFRFATPLILVLDDLQWADGDTIEWLHYFVRSAPTCAVWSSGPFGPKRSRTTRRSCDCFASSNTTTC